VLYTGLQIKISFNSIAGFRFRFRLIFHRNTSPNQGSWGEIIYNSISIVPILATEALNGGIYSMNAIVIHPNIPHSLTHPSIMTVVSDDPSWWPLIIFTVFNDYGLGSSSVWWCLDLILTCILQLPSASWWYTIGVSRTFFGSFWHSYDITSTNTRTRGGSMLSPQWQIRWEWCHRLNWSGWVTQSHIRR
jgi:hypothetical protein